MTRSFWSWRRAAGIEHEWDGNGRILLRAVPFRNYVNYEPWNPLEDDGDALRLASKLRIKVTPGKHKGDGACAESIVWKATGVTVFGNDGMAAQMRRAITMVAADIQRNKEAGLA